MSNDRHRPAAAPDPLPPHPFGPTEFAKAINVSRETLARLEIYAALLIKWQKAINLVGPKTINDLWRRHFLDSAQLLTLAPKTARRFVDLGSGAGFPGLVLSILGAPEVHLIESDTKKCTFLSEVVRATEAQAQIHRARIEALPSLQADVITARALAPLPQLLTWAQHHRRENTVFLFLKGQDIEVELTEATKSWKLEFEQFRSHSDPRGSVLRITKAEQKSA